MNKLGRSEQATLIKVLSFDRFLWVGCLGGFGQAAIDRLFKLESRRHQRIGNNSPYWNTVIAWLRFTDSGDRGCS